MRYRLRLAAYDICQEEFDKLPLAEQARYEAIKPPSHPAWIPPSWCVQYGLARIYARFRQGHSRRIFVLSYAWLTKHHPDPDGDHLRRVVAYFRGLRADGCLPERAGLFWDFGSLPQKPRTAKETAQFKRAISIMADLYAAPLSTVVIQLLHVPPRPRRFDARLLLCEVADDVDAVQLQRIFGSHAGFVSCERCEDCHQDVRLRFSDHASAERALASFKELRSLEIASCSESGAWLTEEYNSTRYLKRGW